MAFQGNGAGVYFLGEGSMSHSVSQNCVVENVFGNMFECKTCNQSHVCDQNCDQRIFYDNSTTICRFSRRLFPLSPEEMIRNQTPKRSSDMGSGSGDGDRRVRRFSSPGVGMASPPPQMQTQSPYSVFGGVQHAPLAFPSPMS